jgi:hypothetical protein
MRELLTLRHISTGTKLNGCGLTKLLKHILNLDLHLFRGQYFNMKTEEQKTKRVQGSRLSSIIFLLRLAGIPFKMKKISNIYAIYMITVIFSTCTTVLGMFADVYIQRDDLGHIMTNIRMLIVMVNTLWNCAYARYVRTYVETLLASQVFV